MDRKVWFVTGASRGFGAEIAKAALGAGELVVATARNPESLRHLGEPGSLLTQSMDVTDEEQVRRATAGAVTRFGRIDFVVNNAGYGLLGAVEECSAAEIEKIYRTNVFGTLNMIRAVLPIMRKQRSGHIINFSSLGGYAASVGWGVYCSTKFAVEGISEALHAELAPLGIHVTVVEPGFFRTDFLDSRSLNTTAATIADYTDSVGKMREFAAGHNHQQPGDPVKLAAAILALSNATHPPVRLPLGSDALRRIAEKNDYVEKETEQWRELAVSTDFAT